DEPLAEDHPTRVPPSQHLDRAPTAELEMHGLVHDPHAACAQLADEAVAAEFSTAQIGIGGHDLSVVTRNPAAFQRCARMVFSPASRATSATEEPRDEEEETRTATGGAHSARASFVRVVVLGGVERGGRAR